MYVYFVSQGNAMKNKNKCKINDFTNENELLRVQQAATHCIVITAIDSLEGPSLFLISPQRIIRIATSFTPQ